PPLRQFTEVPASLLDDLRRSAQGARSRPMTTPQMDLIGDPVACKPTPGAHLFRVALPLTPDTKAALKALADATTLVGECYANTTRERTHVNDPRRRRR